MVFFYNSIDKSQTTNELSIKLSIMMLKHCTIQVLLFNAHMMFLMESKNTCTLKSSINNSNIALSLIVSVYNALGNKVVSVMFAYLEYEGGGSFDFELYLSIDSMNALGNDKEFKASLL